MTLTWTKLHEDDGLEARHRRVLADSPRLRVKGRRTCKESMPVEAGGSRRTRV